MLSQYGYVLCRRAGQPRLPKNCRRAGLEREALYSVYINISNIITSINTGQKFVIITILPMILGSGIFLQAKKFNAIMYNIS